MKKLNIVFIIFLSSIIVHAKTDKNPLVLIKTEMGNIEVEIYQNKAPISAGNFLNCVDDGVYKDSYFYRTVTPNNQPDDDIKIEVIQGGLLDKADDYPPIKHETTKKTGILHKDGTISYARNEPGTATTEFFICIGNQPELDYGGKRNPDRQGFAAFGRVVKGMDIVRKIHKQPAEKQMLKPKIRIFNIERLKQG
ncbi:MAG: peptidylprolyl isomerase [Ignavibacteriaceae bacterium]